MSEYPVSGSMMDLYKAYEGIKLFTGEEVQALLSDGEFKMKDVEALAEDASCAICQEPYNESNYRAVELTGNPDCRGHIFGRDCILQWLEEQNTCQLCRSLQEKSTGGRPTGIDIKLFREAWQEYAAEHTIPSTVRSVHFVPKVYFKPGKNFAVNGRWAKTSIARAIQLIQLYIVFNFREKETGETPLKLTEEEVRGMFLDSELSLAQMDGMWSNIRPIKSYSRMPKKMIEHTQARQSIWTRQSNTTLKWKSANKLFTVRCI